jgi:hypothetical protein
MSAKAKKFRRHFGPPAATFDDQNIRAAKVILAKDPDATGLAAEWAKLVLSRAGSQSEPVAAEERVCRQQ